MHKKNLRRYEKVVFFDFYHYICRRKLNGGTTQKVLAYFKH